LPAYYGGVFYKRLFLYTLLIFGHEMMNNLKQKAAISVGIAQAEDP